MTTRKSPLRWILPVVVIILAFGAVVAMKAMKPEVQKKEVVFQPPMVRVIKATSSDYQYTVRSQGTVQPRTESQLVPEVSGKILKVSPAFNSGGFFEKGDLLLEIDSYDYRQAIIRARAEVARAELRLAREEAEAAVAKKEWEELGEGREPTPLTLHEPQVRDAIASLDASRAALDQAGRNLERTRVEAPYAGRIRVKMVDVGQFVNRGAPLATIYSTDFAEIRLPLPDSDIAFIDLPMAFRGSRPNRSGGDGSTVTLSSEFGGKLHSWQGKLVRTEGEIDRRSRMVHAIAQVADPYRVESGTDRPPLATGMFVNAEIHGRPVQGVFLVPRGALRGKDQILIVDRDNRLRFRSVQVLRTTRDRAVVGDGLEDGDQVCISPLQIVTDGMKVRIFTGDGDDS
jgi:RND family efflux transporter MFP subunit